MSRKAVHVHKHQHSIGWESAGVQTVARGVILKQKNIAQHPDSQDTSLALHEAFVSLDCGF